MSVFKRGRIWWYEFVFSGQRVREPSKSRSKTVAVAAERRRRRELEEGFNGLRKRVHPKLLSVAAEEWLAMKRHVLAPRSVLIERTNLGHLLPEIGKLLISDIGSDDIGHYQQKRLRQGASPKTVNLEIGTIRAILRRNKVWERVREDVRMLPTRSDFGRALNIDEERTLLAACAKAPRLNKLCNSNCPEVEVNSSSHHENLLVRG